MGGGKLPVLTARELIGVLHHLGFEHRPLGATSHRRYVHPDGRKVTVPVHAGQDISRGLLRKILRDVGLSPEELRGLL